MPVNLYSREEPLAKSLEAIPQKTLARLALLILTLLALAVLWPLRNCDFVNYDDDRYIVNNPYLADGLSWKGIRWALSADLIHPSPNVDYWQPVTLFSRMMDVQLFGFDPSGHHRVNLILHVINGLLLFSLFYSLTGALVRSAVLAGLFLIHPLQVEAVAWVTARKDLLYVFFGLLALFAYKIFLKRPSPKQASWVIFLFVLSLMSKPMLITLPFLLLLMDYWKEGKIKIDAFKGLLLGISLIFSILPFRGQPQALSYFSPLALFLNIPVRYAAHLKKIFTPTSLAVYPPLRNIIPSPGLVIGTTIFLLLVTLAVIWQAKRRPYLAVGWFWFLIGLLPTVGSERFEDRCMYFPIIGFFLMTVWGVSEWMIKRNFSKPAFTVLILLIFFLIAPVTYAQTQYWKDSMTLFDRSLRVNPENFLAHNQLCAAWSDRREYDKALSHCIEALKIRPGLAEVHYNLGVAYAGKKEWKKAVENYELALSIKPRYAKAHNNLAAALIEVGQTEEALSHFNEALRLEPDSAEVRHNYGLLLMRTGKPEEAMSQFKQVIQLRPDSPVVYQSLGVALAKQGKWYEAALAYRTALRLAPDYFEARNNLATALVSLGQVDEAVQEYREALRLNPQSKMSQESLRSALELQKKKPSP